MSAVEKSTTDWIEQSQGLVRSLAWKISRGLPAHVEFDDLVAYGQVGLAEAARDFDPSRGGQFSTFAYYRIRGAIYDGLGKMAWFRRPRNRKLRFEKAAAEVLASEAAAPPAPSDDSASTQESWNWLKGLTSQLAMAYLMTHSDDGERQEMQLEDQHASEPEEIVASIEGQKILNELIEELPEQSRTLIQAAYFEGLTLQEAGQRIGISKAWASRLHAKTLDRLAAALRARGISG